MAVRNPLYFSGGKYFNNDEGGQEDYGSGIYSDFYISKELNNFKEKNKVLIEQFISSLEKISKNNFVILVYPVPEVGFLPPFKIFINYVSKILKPLISIAFLNVFSVKYTKWSATNS